MNHANKYRDTNRSRSVELRCWRHCCQTFCDIAFIHHHSGVCSDQSVGFQLWLKAEQNNFIIKKEMISFIRLLTERLIMFRNHYWSVRPIWACWQRNFWILGRRVSVHTITAYNIYIYAFHAVTKLYIVCSEASKYLKDWLKRNELAKRVWIRKKM